MSEVMGIVKFTKTIYQLWSCHVTLASNSENFYFLSNSILKFRKSCQVWEILVQEKKVTGKKRIGGEKHPLPPPVLTGLKNEVKLVLTIKLSRYKD